MEVQEGAGTGEDRGVWAEAQGEYSPAGAAERLQAHQSFLSLNEGHTVQLSLGSFRALVWAGAMFFQGISHIICPIF